MASSVTPAICAVGLLSATMLSTAAATAWADDGSIVLDFVRHGESGDMTAINTLVPGPDLTDAGEQQAQVLAECVGAQRYRRDLGVDHGPIAGDRDTSGRGAGIADPALAGLNEIDAGIFEGAPVNVGDLPLGGALYLLAPALWTLGLAFVPELGSTDANGIVFDESVSDAIQQIYDGSVANNR